MEDLKNFSKWWTIALLFISITGCKPEIKDYPIQPVPFTSVKLSDHFWAPRIQKNHVVTIPIALKQCEITGRIKNFKIAGKLEAGSFCSIFPFDDSDVFKIIEGASFSLQTFPDKALENYLDTLIAYIALAQEPDGYLYTNRTIDPTHAHEWAGTQRWANDSNLSHELYNIGHLYEAAVAHYAATGKRNLLDVAIKSADLVDKEFGPGKLTYYPGHQVIEMGLVKLYRVTNDERYLKLARFFLDTRGPNGQEYCQAHQKIFDQDKIVGHAVRATYMYSGMADIAAILHNKAYSKPLFKIWDDLISTKYYITGGIGSSGNNEGFGEPYDLPNMTAYCETCASIGLVYWNYRMFLLTGEAKYLDVLERTLYNALLSGVSISGDRFFYPNVLESRGQHERSEWFGCACCPGNICRFLPSLPGYIYSVKKNQLYLNLYVSNKATIEMPGLKTEIEQQSGFPDNGKVSIILNPEKETKIDLKLRVPYWTQGQAVPSDLYHFTKGSDEQISLLVNGEKQPFQTKNGYISLSRKWKKGDKIELELPMEIRLIKANPKVAGNRGKVSLQRGPFVFCLEWPENQNIFNLVIDTTTYFKAVYKKELLNGVTVISGKGTPLSIVDGKLEPGNPVDFTAIPYFAWANRGSGEMAVWMAVDQEVALPAPGPTLASTSEIKSSIAKKTIIAVNDRQLPDSSNDQSVMYFHWWPKKDTALWLEYTFTKPETISESSVYWFDDGPHGGCRLPESWKILYKLHNKWVEVSKTNEYPNEKNKLNTIRFNKITTQHVRLEVRLQKEWSAGIYEWSVN